MYRTANTDDICKNTYKLSWVDQEASTHRWRILKPRRHSCDGSQTLINRQYNRCGLQSMGLVLKHSQVKKYRQTAD